MKETTPMHTQLLAIICSVFDAYSATLYLPEADHEECEKYTLAATFSLGDMDDYRPELLAGVGLAGEAVRQNTPLVMVNYDASQQSLGYYKDERDSSIKAFMGCPVPSGGIICVDSKKLYSFSDKDSKILQLFADLVNHQAPETATLSMPGDPASIAEYFACLGILRNLRFQHKRWPVFLQNFLRTVAFALRFDYCAFASLDPSEESYILEGESRPTLLQQERQAAFPLSSGMVGWAFRDGQQALFSEGLKQNSNIALFGKHEALPQFQAIICAPVMVNKSTRGVLCLGHSEAHEMDEALRSFVYQAVDFLGLFLENLYLRSRLHQMLPVAHVHERGSAGTEQSPLTSEEEPC